MRRKSIADEVAEWACHAHKLIHALHAREPSHHTFSQKGMLDGRNTVVDYIEHGELGIAVEHLLYMIHNAEVAIEQLVVIRLHQIAEELNLENPYASKNLSKLNGPVYNVPTQSDVWQACR